MNCRICSLAPSWRRLTVIMTLALGLAPSAFTQAMPGPGTRPAVKTDGPSSLPLPAQAAISSALGRDQKAYHAQARGNGFEAENPQHALSAAFTPEGVQIQTNAARFGLRFQGHGYGDAIAKAGAVAPQASSNRVEYQHGDLTEWWVNGPLGIEQGFTLNRAPERGQGPLTIALMLSGDLSAALEPDRKSLSLSSPDGSTPLRYAGLVANDATGRALPAWFEIDGTRLALRVDDAGAQYPVIVDPFVQNAKLTASDALPNDSFGYSVAVDGDTVVVGAPFDDAGTKTDSGVAYVFVKPVTGWATTATVSATLDANTAKQAGDLFGQSVAVHGDTIVVGAPLEDSPPGSNQGAAYVFTKPAGGWSGAPTQSAKLRASDKAVGDQFGHSVAINGDTVAVGASGDDSARGSVYVFVKPAGGWSGNTNQNAKLIAFDGLAGDSLGSSVAVSGDTILTGAHLDDLGVNIDVGSAYVFVEPVGGWSGNLAEIAKLTASDGVAAYHFGQSLAMSGSTAVIGAAGSAYVFVEPAGGWSGSLFENAKLTASDGVATDNFGHSVAASGDAIVVGAYQHQIGINVSQGSAYVFRKPAGGWSGNLLEETKLTASDGAANDDFGFSVAVSGPTVVLGASGFNANQGAAYVFGGDVTPPEITYALSGTLGDNGWYVSDVTVDWTVTDPESAVTIIDGCVDTTISADTLPTTLSCTATSDGGQSTDSVTLKRDASKPGLVGSRAPSANADGWNNNDVMVSFICTDGLSGIESCTPDQMFSSEGTQSATGTGTDKAGNSKSTTVSGINIDRAAPVVTVTGVTQGGLFELGLVPQVGCSSSDALSGVKIPAVLSVTGGSSAGLGNFIASCSGAEDNAGNLANTAAVSFTVSVKCGPTLATILGTEGNDTILGTAGPDVIHGLEGNDTIDGLGSNDVLCGGTGNDVIKGGAGRDTLLGGPDKDRLYGGGGPDCLRGEAGDDRLNGGGARDVCDGGEHKKGNQAKNCERMRRIP